MLKMNSTQEYRDIINSDIIPLLHPCHEAFISRIHVSKKNNRIILILAHTNKDNHLDYIIVELPGEIRSKEHFIIQIFSVIESNIVDFGAVHE